jgi:DNA-binding MarR family transcriptional regulator
VATPAMSRTHAGRRGGPRRSNDAAASTHRFTYLVKQLQEALRVRLNEITEQFDLTPKQYTALSVLVKHPGVSSAALGRLTFVTPQAANEIVLALERKGFLKRAVDKRNRRTLEVSLTRRGTNALARCDERVDRLETFVFRDVAASDRAQFRDMLVHCLETVSEHGTDY